MLETLLGQVLPFASLDRLRIKNPAWPIGVSTVWFGLGHVPGTGIEGFLVGFPAGIILGYTFWRRRRVGFANGYWMTVTVHASRNLVATFLSLWLPVA